MTSKAKPRTVKPRTVKPRTVKRRTVTSDDDLSIRKPGAFNLDNFKSTIAPTIAGVETLLTALPPLHSSASS